MSDYRCTVCNWVYEENKEDKKFSELPSSWRCPVCNSKKRVFILLDTKSKIKIKQTVSDVFIEQLTTWGVTNYFGIPGTSTLGVLDAIRKNPKANYLQVRHEQTAAFMASAYGKLTGHVAACLAVAGPGTTNLTTGLYDAKLDNSPVLALTGLVKRQMIGPGTFQEIDQHSLFEPICKFNKVLMSEEQTTKLATLAVKHALIKKGVSHISIPNDVQKLSYRTKILPFKGRITNTNISQPTKLIKEAASVIDKSKRPVIISGFGCINEGENLLKLANKISCPIVTTFRGKGVIDEDHELYVGSHGTIGSTSASDLVQKSDLLIVIGSSFSDMTQIPEKKIIQIDIDPMILGKEFPSEVSLWGNSATIIPLLTKQVSIKNNPKYLLKAKKLKAKWIKLLEKESDATKKPVRPQYIIKALNDLLPKDAVISLDIGENGWWFGRNFFMKKTQKMIMSGYLASMGFGLPGALAAKILYPKREVICITGDGGFTMVMGDFLTAVKNNLPIKVFLFNNKQLGMIMQEQKVENYKNWETELHNCDFAKYAENCGGLGIKVTDPKELPKAIEKALASNKATIVDIDTDPKRFL
ncbi:thiamine pyrophosphate-binding protein [archaeon]|jgi:pyruvate oxidase|nr:thiamine pyrophosphate-binding protein [archaeon]MBT3730486.1 thiamine pyrophosphate-binding protein [archaeon]MBT4669448.1 thiamine pyrophosphate-binding protein [archaeon]MBT5029799.1 thiamine pyrophosphate-binding protein [archaeon]MBT5288012.1 thiamine pyrophosphate-binding protein [archaeon]